MNLRPSSGISGGYFLCFIPNGYNTLEVAEEVVGGFVLGPLSSAPFWGGGDVTILPPPLLSQVPQLNVRDPAMSQGCRPSVTSSQGRSQGRSGWPEGKDALGAWVPTPGHPGHQVPDAEGFVSPRQVAEDEVSDNSAECVVCLSDVRDTLILPCRHLCLCNTCADTLRYQANNCPICRLRMQACVGLGGRGGRQQTLGTPGLP